VDFAAKAVEELEEEAGLPRERVRSTQALCLYPRRIDDSYDLCCLIDVVAPEAEILAGFTENPEYSDPVLVPETALANFLREESARLLPVSKGMGRAYLDMRKMENDSGNG
jgi:hypothetical protein